MSSVTAPTASRAEKAKTRTSAPGSERRRSGFTLVELLVVLVLIALASGVAGLALRQSDESRLEREAARLAALLEGARAEARASGLLVRFSFAADAATNPTEAFRFDGLRPEQSPPTHWLEPGTSGRVEGGGVVLLGPEPMIGRQRIVLSSGERTLVLATDGLSPFAVQAPEDDRP